MTQTLDTAYAALVDSIKGTDDLVEQYQAIKGIEERFDSDMKQFKATIATKLYEGRTWAQVGEMLGVTGARAEQISRAAR